MDRGKTIAGIVIGVLVIGGCTAAMNDTSTTSSAKPNASTTTDTKSDNKKAPETQETQKPQRTQAEEFTDCVNKNGTPTEKTAVKHVTKVTGADKRNNILDSAEIYTDFTGGIIGPHQGDAKLIASAFTSCYKSDNGLVTVYGEDGEMIANANF